MLSPTPAGRTWPLSPESDQKMAQTPINKINNVIRLPYPRQPLPAKNFQSRVHVHQHAANPNAVFRAEWLRLASFKEIPREWPLRCLRRGVKVVIWLSPIACLCAKRYSINFFRAINPIDVRLHFDVRTFALRKLQIAHAYWFLFIYVLNNVEQKRNKYDNNYNY